MAAMADREAVLGAFAEELTLRDGTRLRVRPIRPDDEPRLVDLYSRLSRHTAYQRFFTVMQRLPPDWARFLANVDYRTRFALVADHAGPAGLELVAVARYEPAGEPGVAEVAIVVQDGWQNRGLGTYLLRRIVEAGVANGVGRFRAWVLADNHRMLDLLARVTDVRERRLQQSVVELTFTRRSHEPGLSSG